MSARPMIAGEDSTYRPRLAYSAGFDLAALEAADRDALAAHCRSLAAMRASIGWGTLGELYTIPKFGRADFATDHVVAARIGQGPILATAQVHRVSRLLAWAELWYTAWPGAWCYGACAQCIARGVRWARAHGLACLVAYTHSDNDAERELLERAGFSVSCRNGELIAEMDLLD